MAPAEERQPWIRRLRERLIDVLLHHPAELSEFLVGLMALVLGLVLVSVGSPISTDEESLWGGLALALFGLPQMAAAIHGRLILRHVSNLLGAFAALANTLRASRADVPLAFTFYSLLLVCCAFFLARTKLQLLMEPPRRPEGRW